jgi:hypothetical protein
VLLVADASRDNQPALLQPGKLALRRSGASAGVPNELRCVKAPLRIAEQYAKYTLLCFGEQRIRQASSTGATRTPNCAQYGHNHADMGMTVNASFNRRSPADLCYG